MQVSKTQAANDAEAYKAIPSLSAERNANHDGMEADTSFEQLHLPTRAGSVSSGQYTLIDPAEIVVVREMVLFVYGRRALGLFVRVKSRAPC